MGNILLNTFNVNYESQDKYSKIICKFANRNNDFETETVEALVPFSLAPETAYFETVLDGITNKLQAQRECNLIAGRQYFQSKTYSWSTGEEGFLAKRGDLVYLSHDATQYGSSGRIVNFIVKNNKIYGFKTTAILRNSNWVLIKLPNNEMKKYRCEKEDDFIKFIDDFEMTDAPYQLLDKKRDAINELSRFPDSIAEDYHFISDIKENVGKLVRIMSVTQTDKNVFTYSAKDEDQALWAFEHGIQEESTAIDDSLSIVEVFDVTFLDLGDGLCKILWNSTRDCVFMIVDKFINAPVDINGRFTTIENEVTLQLERKLNYNFKIVPLSVNEKIISKSSEVKFGSIRNRFKTSSKKDRRNK